MSQFTVSVDTRSEMVNINILASVCWVEELCDALLLAVNKIERESAQGAPPPPSMTTDRV